LDGVHGIAAMAGVAADAMLGMDAGLPELDRIAELSRLHGVTLYAYNDRLSGRVCMRWR